MAVTNLTGTMWEFTTFPNSSAVEGLGTTKYNIIGKYSILLNGQKIAVSTPTNAQCYICKETKPSYGYNQLAIFTTTSYSVDNSCIATYPYDRAPYKYQFRLSGGGLYTPYDSDVVVPTIEITGGTSVTNTTLISWLEANATNITPTPSVNNISIGDLQLSTAYIGTGEVQKMYLGETEVWSTAT